MCESIQKSPDHRHYRAYAQEPSRQPKGAARVAIPGKLVEEYLDEIISRRPTMIKAARQPVVIDLFCGYQSIRATVEGYGFKYVGVDIRRLFSDHPT